VSSDGTSEAIADQFPEVTVLHAVGQLYWKGGRGAPAATASCREHVQETTKETVLIPELIEHHNNAASAARR
jgi:hypothetical protein